MPEIDFSIPYWLITYYHFIGIISLCCDGFAIYLILFQSSKIDNFRYFLLNFQIACSLFYVHITFVSQPVPLYPLLSGYLLGFAARFEAPVYHCLLIGIALGIYQIASMIFCFVKKHQTIANTLKKYVIPSALVWLLFIFCATFLVCVVAFFSRTTVDENEKFDYIRQNLPEYLSSFQTLPNFSIYIADSYFLTVVLSAISVGILVFIMLILIIINIFRMLNLLKLQISASNYQKHRVAIWSLLAQFAMSSVLFVPPIIYVCVVLIGFKGGQLIVECLLVIACLHSILNVSVLVITFPPYRRFVTSSILKKRKQMRIGIAGILSKPSLVVVSHG